MNDQQSDATPAAEQASQQQPSERQALYDAKIKPLVDQLRDACAEHGFYTVTAVEIEQIDEGDGKFSSSVSCAANMAERACPTLQALYFATSGEKARAMYFLAVQGEAHDTEQTRD